METLADSLIDGFILSLSKGTMQSQDFHHIDEVMLQGMPVVLFDRIADQIRCDKVVVDDTRDIYITWRKFPMKYNFMLFSNGIIVAGRMHLANNTLQDFKNLFNENLDAFEKLQKDIVVFDKSNMKLSYSSILGNGYANVANMKCVSVD